MKIFIAYKYSDFEESNEGNIKQLKKIIEFFNPDFEILMLEKSNFFWKLHAKKKIKETSVVFYIQGKDESKNVYWELSKAVKQNKRIIKIDLENERRLLSIYLKIMNSLKADSSVEELGEDVDFYSYKTISNETVEELNTLFSEADIEDEVSSTDVQGSIITCLKKIESNNKKFNSKSEKKLPFYKILEPCSIYKFQYDIIQHKESRFGLFNLDLDKLRENKNAQVLQEQYKIFIQSSETLMQRRQSANSFYLTINTALIAIFAALISLKLMVNYIVLIGSLLCIIGMITSKAWETILISYGVLNKSKIQVISMIEDQLPASLYDAEWNVMNNVSMNENYKPFTKTESFTAYTFFILYLIMFILCLMYFFYKLFPFIKNIVTAVL